MDFVLSVWREASRQLELESSIDRIARLAASTFPAEALIVRALDFQHASLNTVAVGLCRPGPLPARVNTDFSAEQFSALIAWCRRKRVASGTADTLPFPLHDAVLPGDAAQWMVGPLLRDDTPLGLLLLSGRPTARFQSKHESLMQGMLEPISVALANTAHYHQVRQLREAVEADNRALLSRLERDAVTDAIVGADTGLQSVMERINQVAPTDAPVLILGETGSGKEVLARAIHSQSGRASAAIVRVNCGALPPGLIDSELFGHERGSFTGAVNVRKGWFERADGGTLFLDEIGELPGDAQVRLLRILQDGTFERIGGHKPLKVDVRIVAATHRDLQEMVAQGAFREDLWYRISVFPIHLPPLRERVEDIAALAAHFAARAGKRLGGAPLALSLEDIDVLVSYPWPGNVRELAAVIERAAILGNGRELRIEAALGPVGRRSGRMSAKDWAARAASATAVSEAVTLDAAMKAHITQVLRATHGRIEGPFGAAARLDVNPHTLRARMRKLGINWSRFRNVRRSSRQRTPDL